MKDSWQAGQYERFRQERERPFYDLMALIHPREMERAIDLGCGTGALTRSLHERFHLKETRGLDSSAAMLSNAQAKDGLSFVQQDINAWQETNAYDLVVSNAALHWCPKHDIILQRCFAALRSEGQLAIQMPANEGSPTHRLADTVAQEEAFRSFIPGDRGKSLLPLESYATLLYKLGFREQLVQLRVYPHVLAKREDVLEWVKGSLLTYYQAALPAELFSLFLLRYEERLMAELADERPFFFPFKRILIWARK